MSTFRNMQTIKENRGRYRVKNPFSPKAFLSMLGAMAAILAALLLIAVLLRIRVAGLLVFALPIPLGLYVTKRTAFGVTAQTVVVDGVQVPWEHVRRRSRSDSATPRSCPRDCASAHRAPTVATSATAPRAATTRRSCERRSGATYLHR